jgi:hypothetical protein
MNCGSYSDGVSAAMILRRHGGKKRIQVHPQVPPPVLTGSALNPGTTLGDEAGVRINSTFDSTPPSLVVGQAQISSLLHGLTLSVCQQHHPALARALPDLFKHIGRGIDPKLLDLVEKGFVADLEDLSCLAAVPGCLIQYVRNNFTFYLVHGFLAHFLQ